MGKEINILMFDKICYIFLLNNSFLIPIKSIIYVFKPNITRIPESLIVLPHFPDPRITFLWKYRRSTGQETSWKDIRPQ